MDNEEDNQANEAPVDGGGSAAQGVGPEMVRVGVLRLDTYVEWWATEIEGEGVREEGWNWRWGVRREVGVAGGESGAAVGGDGVLLLRSWVLIGNRGKPAGPDGAFPATPP
ncbi:hypothetical protein CYMTET_18927 [Cymbomonas tetramitiformis]|uniref:Uncharacterized protein n=1 Tax=Cymbomonas tetramitiformis TaxID=36881 RepID=A0AAE0L5R9_9CHLO|nr:hypothetical protein CYMTET_18927 [Cymbomonas tetramitiformis]